MVRLSTLKGEAMPRSQILDDPEEPTDTELYLSELSNSDEDLEALLSGGADIDDLIMAGVLDDGSDETWGWQDVAGIPDPQYSSAPMPLSEAEFRVLMERGHWFLRRGWLDAPSQPH